MSELEKYMQLCIAANICSASGVAVSLELARIFAKYKPKATIVFTAFAGEEQGLLGAENLAQTYKNTSVNVAGMINLDMVGKYVVHSSSQHLNPLLTEHPAPKLKMGRKTPITSASSVKVPH